MAVPREPCHRNAACRLTEQLSSSSCEQVPRRQFGCPWPFVYPHTHARTHAHINTHAHTHTHSKCTRMRASLDGTGINQRVWVNQTGNRSGQVGSWREGLYFICTMNSLLEGQRPRLQMIWLSARRNIVGNYNSISSGVDGGGGCWQSMRRVSSGHGADLLTFWLILGWLWEEGDGDTMTMASLERALRHL